MKTRGGWVLTWHIYRPASSFSIGFMCKRQLFGYWNVTLNRGSPVWVIFPTDNKENLSTVRRTHITWRIGNTVEQHKRNDSGQQIHIGFCRFVQPVAVWRIPHHWMSTSKANDRRNHEKEKRKNGVRIGEEYSDFWLSYNKTQLICTFQLPLSELEPRCDYDWHR